MWPRSTDLGTLDHDPETGKWLDHKLALVLSNLEHKRLGTVTGEFQVKHLEEFVESFYSRQVPVNHIRRHALPDIPSSGTLVRHIEHEARTLCKDTEVDSMLNHMYM